MRRYLNRKGELDTSGQTGAGYEVRGGPAIGNKQARQ
jgi:hypothetical protein